MSTRGMTPRRRVRPPTAEAYSSFIGQIELLDVWLIGAHIENRHGRRAPVRSGVAVTSPEPTWEEVIDGFDVRFPYVVQFTDGGELHAELKVTFGLHFSSGQPMTDGLFRVFKAVNLPVNTWPFLREFVSTTLGRMGWEPFTLPALKVGIPEENDAEEERPAASTRRQRTRPR